MKVLRPLLVVGRQTSGEVLDIVLLAVPVTTACQKLMNRIIVFDMCRLDIDADIVHPAFAALLHLLHDYRLQLAVGQWLPWLECQVVGTVFRHLLHHIVAQLVAAGKKVLDEADDAFLLVHLRECPPVVWLLIGFAEHLTDDI